MDGRTVLLPDTHAHLDAAEFSSDLDEVLSRATEAGVDRILAVGSDFSSSLRAVAIARQHDAVFAAVGVHPHEAGRFQDEAEAVRRLLTEKKVVAIGEIGLDYYRALAPREAQVMAFRAQLQWAENRGLPVSVHNRSADADVLEILGEMPVRAILHCFSGTQEFAAAAVQAGYFLSFAGNLTYRKAEELRAVSRAVPADRVLVETDAPVIPPQPWRGKRNEPAYVVATAEMLAIERGIPMRELAETISRNADTLLRWRAA